MDEKTAWQCFLRTGSVSDYLAYIKVKDNTATAVIKETADADKDGRTDYTGADCR